MKKYTCAYAYDVPHYFEFDVEAESEAEAQRKIDDAFERGIFDHAIATMELEATDNYRCVVWGESEEDLSDEEKPLLDLKTPVENDRLMGR
jgi:hypothetical protein